MKKAYLITYDYKGSAENYEGLFNELKAFQKWWHYINNSWIVITSHDSNSIYRKLKPHLDEKINLLVIEVGKDRSGWLPIKAWDWINENLDSLSNLRPTY